MSQWYTWFEKYCWLLLCHDAFLNLFHSSSKHLYRWRYNIVNQNFKNALYNCNESNMSINSHLVPRMFLLIAFINQNYRWRSKIIQNILIQVNCNSTMLKNSHNIMSINQTAFFACNGNCNYPAIPISYEVSVRFELIRWEKTHHRLFYSLCCHTRGTQSDVW